jgi:hypothetical protein
MLSDKTGERPVPNKEFRTIGEKSAIVMNITKILGVLLRKREAETS